MISKLRFFLQKIVIVKVSILLIFWVENFKIVDIEINVWSLYIILKINLIFSFYPGKYLKFKQSDCRLENPNSQSDCWGILKFSAGYRWEIVIGRNPGAYPIGRINNMIISFQSGDLDSAKGFRISNSKVFSSEDLN